MQITVPKFGRKDKVENSICTICRPQYLSLFKELCSEEGLTSHVEGQKGCMRDIERELTCFNNLQGKGHVRGRLRREKLVTFNS